MNDLNKYPRPQPVHPPIWPLFAVAAGIGLTLAALITVDPVGRVTACAVALEGAE